MRKKLVAGNWKMNTDLASAETLVREIVGALKSATPKATVVLCPPFIALERMHQLIHGTALHIGAQNLHFENDGAFTGEISATMLKSVGCEYVIIGHSERRQFFGETEYTVNRRLLHAIKNNLRPIVCVGETLEHREEGATFNVVRRQLTGAFYNVEEAAMNSVVIAYEPVWAIGTGKTATPEQAQEVHESIRSLMSGLYSRDIADALPILYGGSVKADNAATIFSQPDVDGGLIGGASLKAKEFCAIVNAC